MKLSSVSSKPAIRQALYLLLLSGLAGILANTVNPRGIAIRLHPPGIVAGVSLADLQPGQTPPVVGTSQVRQLIGRQGALLIDARTAEEYASGHLPDAINIPFEELFAHLDALNTLPREPWLICYCDGPPCDLSHLLAAELARLGYARVAIYEAGLDDWKKTAPVATGEEEHHE